MFGSQLEPVDPLELPDSLEPLELPDSLEPVGLSLTLASAPELLPLPELVVAPELLLELSELPEPDPDAPLVLPAGVELDEPLRPEDDPLALPSPLIPPKPGSDPTEQHASVHAEINETMNQLTLDVCGIRAESFFLHRRSGYRGRDVVLRPRFGPIRPETACYGIGRGGLT
jgi:hypothetical protein